MDLGLELRISRIKAGLQQQQIARQIGIEATRLSKIEHGWLEPSEEETERIKEAIEQASARK